MADISDIQSKSNAFEALLLGSASANQAALQNSFDVKSTAYLLAALQFSVAILYAFVAKSEEIIETNEPGSVLQGYNMFSGIEVMM